MVFSSILFLGFFLPAFLLVYYLAPRFRNAVLLLFSIVFYAWGEPSYIVLMLISITVNHGAALRVAASRTDAGARAWVIAGIAANLAALFWFKYIGFFVHNVDRWLGLNWSRFDICHVALPVGLSFYTFQGMSYLIDVYRKDYPPARSWKKVALYISMFPQLVAGPIVRYNLIADEISRRKITLPMVTTGIWMFSAGLALKCLIANEMGRVADAIYAQDPQALGTTTAWFGTLCYSIQIYCDFAGYSVMALGLGSMIGFTFPENFNRPYLAVSITDFWRRWHITLSTWFRDYLYIPLGGNWRGRLYTVRNLCIVFLLCGAWHGASWMFIIWGAYHGFFLSIERLFRVKNLAVPAVIRHGYTLLVVCVGWTIFRADSIGQAWGMIQQMFSFSDRASLYPVSLYLRPVATLALLAGLIISTVRLPGMQTCRRARETAGPVTAKGVALGLLTALLLLLSAMSLAGGMHNPFIYYRF